MSFAKDPVFVVDDNMHTPAQSGWFLPSTCTQHMWYHVRKDPSRMLSNGYLSTVPALHGLMLMSQNPASISQMLQAGSG